MINLEFGILIDRPVSQVYSFLTNPLNLPRWQANVKEIKALSPGTPGVGSAYGVASEMLGRRIEGKMEIVALEADKAFAFKIAAGPMQLKIDASFKTVGTGTKLAIHAQGEPGGLFKIAEGALTGQVRAQMEANLARLKSVLESES